MKILRRIQAQGSKNPPDFQSTRLPFHNISVTKLVGLISNLNEWQVCPCVSEIENIWNRNKQFIHAA